MVETEVYKFLEKLYNAKIVLGFVHPMCRKSKPEEPITREFSQLYNSETEMCCLPYCVEERLLHVSI